MSTATQPTAASAHNMLKAVGLELAFVVVATMIAGISDTWATSMVALMLALLVLRGLFEVDVFATFAKDLQLSPGTPSSPAGSLRPRSPDAGAGSGL